MLINLFINVIGVLVDWHDKTSLLSINTEYAKGSDSGEPLTKQVLFQSHINASTFFF